MIRLTGFLLNAHGRASRADFFLKLFLPNIALAIAAAVLDLVLWPSVIVFEGQGPSTTAVTLIFAIPILVVGIRRFHDQGLSGWWFVAANASTSAALAMVGAVAGELGPNALFAHPMGIVGLLMLTTAALAQLLLLILLPGRRGPNRFGPDPVKRKAAAPAVTAAA